MLKMKNKEITIYELMGLIKEGKAPYEVIYQGTKYYIDEIEDYYRAEDRTPLFERIFNNYNDYDALQEKVEFLPEENDEWEDIKEIDVGWLSETKPDNTLFLHLINQLIKNQRKILEKLESKDE